MYQPIRPHAGKALETITSMNPSADNARPSGTADLDRARQIAIAMRDVDGALVPILHALQAEFGYIDTALEPVVADVLNLTRAEVHGVVTFYRDFRRAPPARHHLALCRAEACQSMGGEALVARAEARLGITSGATTPDGQVELAAVYCLGLCSVAPSAMVDGRVVGRLDEARLDALLAEVSR
jgi:formate dehydrogenase subunit gamma